jgi:DNA polymerase III sliding clamp (beta) subunit (PCNA family)
MNTFTVDVEKLKNTLNLLSNGLPGRTVVHSAQEFFFLNGEIITFNDEICLKIPYEEIKWEGSIPAEEFMSVLNSCDSKEITISFVDKENVKITSPGVKAELTTTLNNPILESIRSIPTPRRWKKLPKDEFMNVLKICGTSISKDITQGFLTCISIQQDKVFSSDDLRITFATLPQEICSKQILLPWRVLSNLLSYNPTEMAVQVNWAFFKTEEGILFSSRILQEDFPNPEGFFDMDDPITIYFPKNLSEIIATIEVFSKKEMTNNLKKIEIKVAGNEIMFKASSSKGFVEKSLSLEYEGEPFSFILNPDFLTDMSSYCESFDVSLSQNKVLFKGENFKHIALLLQN